MSKVLYFPTDILKYIDEFNNKKDKFLNPYVQIKPIEYTKENAKQGKYAKIDEKSTKNIKIGGNTYSSIVLPFPEGEFSDGNTLKWESASTIGGAIRSKIPDLGNPITDSITLNSGISFGEVETLIFKGIGEMRALTLDYTFYSRFKKEASIARDIARYFRINSLPQIQYGENSQNSGFGKAFQDNKKNVNNKTIEVEDDNTDVDSTQPEGEISNGSSDENKKEFGITSKLVDTTIDIVTKAGDLVWYKSPQMYRVYINYHDNNNLKIDPQPFKFLPMVVTDVKISDVVSDEGTRIVYSNGDIAYKLSITFTETRKISATDFTTNNL